MAHESSIADLASLAVVVKGLERRLYGNGQPGDIAEIKAKLDDLRAWYWKAIGGVAVIAVLVPPIVQLINYAIRVR